MKTTAIRVIKDILIKSPSDWPIDELEKFAQDVCTNDSSLDLDWEMDKVEYEVMLKKSERLWVKK